MTLYAGARVRDLIGQHGLQPAMLSAIAAAAGGPKGLGLIPLDRWLFGTWLREHTAPLELIGASIGAWRMTAAAQVDADARLKQLADTYIGPTPLTRRPSRTEVSRFMRKLATACLPEQGEPRWAAGRRVQVLTARAPGPVQGRSEARHFARMGLANLYDRRALGGYLQRVVFHVDGARPLPVPDDGLGATRCAATSANLADALQASGNLPLLCHPVRGIADAPDGHYWDGGLIDYHLAWPWQQFQGIVLYPHFRNRLVPGWLDKTLPWRHLRAGQHHPWLENVLLITPGPGLLARLPGNRLPERGDFDWCRGDMQALARRWRQAYQECDRLAEAFARWVEKPDPQQLRSL
jgi:hypothetical protein